jgi:hypothetical protein
MVREIWQKEHIQSLDHLHDLIEKHSAWGMSFWDFEKKVCEYVKDGVQYKGSLMWGSSGSTTIQEQYALVQYLHKHYQPK